jgi:hypothetical protein
MGQINDRWNAPTPLFWRKVRRFGLIVAGVAAIVGTAGAAFPLVVGAAAAIGGAGTLTAFLASLTRNDGSIDWDSMTIEQLIEIRSILGAKGKLTQEEVNLFNLLTNKINA